jgi:dihydroorotate dehydrogenase (NAD+) catalytic subunit
MIARDVNKMDETRTSKMESAHPRMAVDIAGVRFKNPVLTASGTFAYGLEFAHLMDLNELGGIVVKGLSMKPIKRQSPAPNL